MNKRTEFFQNLLYNNIVNNPNLSYQDFEGVIINILKELNVFVEKLNSFEYPKFIPSLLDNSISKNEAVNYIEIHLPIKILNSEHGVNELTDIFYRNLVYSPGYRFSFFVKPAKTLIKRKILFPSEQFELNLTDNLYVVTLAIEATEGFKKNITNFYNEFYDSLKAIDDLDLNNNSTLENILKNYPEYHKVIKKENETIFAIDSLKAKLEEIKYKKDKILKSAINPKLNIAYKIIDSYYNIFSNPNKSKEIKMEEIYNQVINLELNGARRIMVQDDAYPGIAPGIGF